MNIRPEQPADRAAIHGVHASSFPTEAEAQLVDDLRAAGRLTVSLVAVTSETGQPSEIVGHLAFSPVTIRGAAFGMGLAPVAVLPGYRLRGIAAQLIRAGLAACQRLQAGPIVVLGDPEYYRRFGFLTAADLGLRDEYGGGPAFQVIEHSPGSIPDAGGVVRYAPEFANLADDGRNE